MNLLVGYTVTFEGINDPSFLKLIQDVSELEKLKDRPVKSYLSLKKRVENDLPQILKVLYHKGFYGANIDYTISEDRQSIQIKINTGPSYPLSLFLVRYFQYGEEYLEGPTSLVNPTFDQLKIKIGETATPEVILNAEDLLLDHVNLQGYPFATIEKRDVFADEEAHNVLVLIIVEIGPKMRFGPLHIEGNKRVNKSFFEKKIKWCEGKTYSPKYIQKTQEALELSGLFRSINISYPDTPPPDDLLPITIRVLEAKQRTIGLGINYMTSLGPGILAEWEDRNFKGSGDRLSARLNAWVKLKNGSIAYRILDFLRQDQDLVWRLDVIHAQTKPYTERALSISGTIERKISRALQFSYGSMFKILRSSNSNNDGLFDLVQFPCQLRWNSTENILDPKTGQTVMAKVIPSIQIRSPRFGYTAFHLLATHHHPITKDKKHVLALKALFGSIIGAGKNEIPPPERLFAGSENTIRGYHYLTVSPLGRDHRVLGGRSLAIGSIEWRAQLSEKIGWVLFYDIGNVYKNSLPEIPKKLLQSSGVGFLYYTPIGPLRLDIAFPWNPRSIDNRLEVYFNIGHPF